MSMINSANPGSQINLLCLIYRIIFRNDGRLSSDEIMSLCRPENLPTLDDHKGRFGENLRFWLEESHQLWIEDDNRKLTLVQKPSIATPAEVAAAASKAIHKIGYDDIFEPKSHDVTPLFRCLGLVLAADDHTVGSGKILNNSSLRELFSRKLPAYMPNDSEKKYVLAYGHFLGYLEPVPDGYVVDVTRAIRRELSEIFEEDQGLNIQEFLRRLAKRLPMLDGGSYRNQIEEKSQLANDESETHYLSRALSLSLERLRFAGKISLFSKADDANAMALRLQHERKMISRVELRS